MSSQMVSLRPVELEKDGGALGLSLVSGTMAAGLAANSEIFQLRWVHPEFLAVLEELSIWAGNAGTAFAAGFCRFHAIPARAWTADGSGGTAATLTGNNGKLRTSHSGWPPAVTARVASTAALTAGTKTLDAQGIGSAGGGVLATAGADLIKPKVNLIEVASLKHPLVLANQEGVVITAAVPATGTWTFGVDVRLSSTRAYDLR